MKSAESAARANYAEAFDAIAEIQDSLSAISLEDPSVRLRSRDATAEQRATEPSRREALESIALLNAGVQRTKERIRRLETGLRTSGVQVAGLGKMIAGLKRAVVEKEQQIAMLTGQVDSLSSRVAGLETTVMENQDSIAAKDQAIEEKRRELGTIYYVVGTKKELADAGIIKSKGGVLGLGKTLQVSGRYDPSRFTALDTDRETTVRAPARKALVVSAQPGTSYQLQVTGGQLELHILDPQEFRKVKHLVIVTS
jgi:chromosome segregation ATPase